MSDYVEFWRCGDCVENQRDGCGKGKEGRVCGRKNIIMLSDETVLSDEQKRKAAKYTTVLLAEQEPPMLVNQFGKVITEGIKIIFVGQDDWEHEAELPAVPRVGDGMTFWIGDFVYDSKVTAIHWSLLPEEYKIVVRVDLERAK